MKSLYRLIDWCKNGETLAKRTVYRILNLVTIPVIIVLFSLSLIVAIVEGACKEVKYEYNNKMYDLRDMKKNWWPAFKNGRMP